METKESKIRKEQFLAEYNKLVKKYDVQLASAPQLVPSGERGFNLSAIIVPIDLRQGGVPSPLNKDEVLK
jgi:MoaA/NifB/PqqE/SkfB family radical SAM enzyme